MEFADTVKAVAVSPGTFRLRLCWRQCSIHTESYVAHPDSLSANRCAHFSLELKGLGRSTLRRIDRQFRNKLDLHTKNAIVYNNTHMDAGKHRQAHIHNPGMVLITGKTNFFRT